MYRIGSEDWSEAARPYWRIARRATARDPKGALVTVERIEEEWAWATYDG